MAILQYYNRSFPCNDGQTVLDVLLENGQDIPYSCKMGVCVTCSMKVVSGDVPAEAQEGLRASLAAQGHFLPCVCHPETDMRIVNIDEQDLFSPAVVRTVEHLTPDISRIYLEPTTPLYYHAGQFMNLRREDGLARSYSLASVPSLDDLLEFHIKRLDQGQMSNWIADDLMPGDHLGVQGPIGNCFYQPSCDDQNLLLIGNGAGLAPLVGIARDALSSGHTGAIVLYHGSQSTAGHYLKEDLGALATQHDNFQYFPCVSRQTEPEGYRRGRADDLAFADHANLKGWRVYLCGYPPMVHSAQARAISAGAHIGDIFTDPYELKDLRKEPRD
jgi:NAD(P)H-flavin reductase/ferredoxin